MSEIKRGQWETYLGHRVRVYGGADWKREGEPWGEGQVVAVCTVPTVIVQHDDGTQTHYASSLPMEVMRWEAL